MLTTLTLLHLAFAPEVSTLAGEWQLVWDQMGTQYIRVTVTEEGPTAKVAWGGESFECTLTRNVCEGFVTENGNAKAGHVKITLSDAEIKGESADLEVAFTFIGTRPTAPPPGGPRTLKFEPAVFHNYFAWNIAPALHIFPRPATSGTMSAATANVLPRMPRLRTRTTASEDVGSWSRVRTP